MATGCSEELGLHIELPGGCLGDMGLFLSFLAGSCSDTGWETLLIHTPCPLPGTIPTTASNNPCYRFKADGRPVKTSVCGSCDALAWDSVCKSSAL